MQTFTLEITITNLEELVFLNYTVMEYGGNPPRHEIVEHIDENSQSHRGKTGEEGEIPRPAKLRINERDPAFNITKRYP